MHLSTLQENLRRGLALAVPATAPKSSLPVLGNVLLRTENDRLVLQSTNLEIGMTVQIGARVEREGAVTLPAKLLSDYVNTLPNDAITMTLDDRTQAVKLSSGPCEANIKGIEADEFPTLPDLRNDTEAVTLTIAADTLRTALSEVVYATADNDTRPVLFGVHIVLKDGVLLLKASDGFVLARKTIEVDTDAAADCLVPRKACDTLLKLIGDADGDMTITIGYTQAMFARDGVELVTRLIDGKYPDLNRVIPQQYTTRAVIDRLALIRAIRQAMVFAVESANIVKFTFTVWNEGNRAILTLQANAAEVGDNQTQIDVDARGDNVQIALNGKFLQDILQSIGTPQIALELQDSAKPAVIRPVGDDSLIALQMPMSIK